jgi:hypothetical protein
LGLNSLKSLNLTNVYPNNKKKKKKNNNKVIQAESSTTTLWNAVGVVQTSTTPNRIVITNIDYRIFF